MEKLGAYEKVEDFELLLDVIPKKDLDSYGFTNESQLSTAKLVVHHTNYDKVFSV